jgi:hypothetical protein
MKKTIQKILLMALITGIACTQNTDNKQKEAKAVAVPLTKEQTNNGKWVLMDDKKTPIYDVFIYDNGPDYPADGLIRVVKNGKIGYADATTFAIVIPPQYDCAFPFENGKAKVTTNCKTVKDGEYNVWESDAWQYVDKTGKSTPQ